MLAHHRPRSLHMMRFWRNTFGTPGEDGAPALRLAAWALADVLGLAIARPGSARNSWRPRPARQGAAGINHAVSHFILYFRIWSNALSFSVVDILEFVDFLFQGKTHSDSCKKQLYSLDLWRGHFCEKAAMLRQQLPWKSDGQSKMLKCALS